MRTVLLGCFILIPSYLIATDWSIMVVDSTYLSGTGGTSVALDSLGYPHLTYRNPNEGLMYASWNEFDSTWVIEAVFDSASRETKIAGCGSSLALDSKDNPHISFWWGDLGYAWKNGTGWHTAHPNPGPWTYSTSLVLDEYDYPHIAYRIRTDPYLWNGVLLHTYWDGYNWNTEIVDSVRAYGFRFSSIRHDKKNILYIAYGETGENGKIGFAYRESDGWRTELVDVTNAEDKLIDCVSLRFNSSNYPCITYSYCGVGWSGGLGYAEKKETGWSFSVIDSVGVNDSLGPVGWGNALCIDQDDNPHVVYEGNFCLKYAYRYKGIWFNEKVDTLYSGGGSDTYWGLEIDTDGYSHISYNQELGGSRVMKYAKGHPEMGIEIEPELPLCALLNVYPSIGKQSVKIEFTLNRKGMANLSIYNIAGQKIIELVNKERDCGTYTILWDIKGVKSGIYFCRLKIGKEVFMTQKIIILR